MKPTSYSSPEKAVSSDDSPVHAQSSVDHGSMMNEISNQISHVMEQVGTKLLKLEGDIMQNIKVDAAKARQKQKDNIDKVKKSLRDQSDAFNKLKKKLDSMAESITTV